MTDLAERVEEALCFAVDYFGVQRPQVQPRLVPPCNGLPYYDPVTNELHIPQEMHDERFIIAEHAAHFVHVHTNPPFWDRLTLLNRFVRRMEGADVATTGLIEAKLVLLSHLNLVALVGCLGALGFLRYLGNYSAEQQWIERLQREHPCSVNAGQTLRERTNLDYSVGSHAALVCHRRSATDDLRRRIVYAQSIEEAIRYIRVELPDLG